MKLVRKTVFAWLCFCGASACSYIAQETQVADPDFTPKNVHRTFSENSPVVYVDEAHHNLLTKSGRYMPFTKVLESDGYTVKPNKKDFTFERLKQVDILVIANALDKERHDWSPPFKEALKTTEVSAVKQWVSDGGALFLVADHTPFPQIIGKLTATFGFVFSNGHVGNAVFRTTDNTLANHSITQGTSQHNELGMEGFMSSLMQGATKHASHSGRITKVRAFGGAAFKAPDDAISLLTLGAGATSITPVITFDINADTPRVAVEGWSQGAILEVGKGRIAVFAEGMMFSSQLDTKTGKRYGLSSNGAEQNEAFLLNVMHWLSGVI
ncbi:DUF4350 domain-containing protein [Alteromonas pelagimontana]|uniref:DUF4350 domain-containing protein n=1 Tax=Alteromonas pelagimontana TaxID=1858656 RepID=A0A6M4MCG8_9ALTE|nr:hypothetical protein [Alteromonas pelagimontana]QJR80350.1 DUF4350 domain-containing protein [Alteromonas pelagimontana]